MGEIRTIESDSRTTGIRTFDTVGSTRVTRAGIDELRTAGAPAELVRQAERALKRQSKRLAHA